MFWKLSNRSNKIHSRKQINRQENSEQVSGINEEFRQKYIQTYIKKKVKKKKPKLLRSLRYIQRPNLRIHGVEEAEIKSKVIGNYLLNYTRKFPNLRKS